MRRRSTALTALLFFAALGSAAVPAETAGPEQLACAYDFQATTGDAAPGMTVLHLRGGRPLLGTVRLYGKERLWTADVINPVTAMSRGGVAEQAALVRTTGPVLGIEFQPQWAGCSMIAAVRPRAPYDVADPANAVDARVGGSIPPAACDRPFDGAHVIHAVEPDTPAMAQQQGITGEVGVAVALDASGRVVASAIQRSPSAVLNSASMAAARGSTYKAAIVACRPVPSAYEFVVSF